MFKTIQGVLLNLVDEVGSSKTVRIETGISLGVPALLKTAKGPYVDFVAPPAIYHLSRCPCLRAECGPKTCQSEVPCRHDEST